MEKVLEQALSELITNSVQTAEKAGNFLVEQTPDVIQQVLVWNSIESLVNCILPVIILSAFLWLFKRFFVAANWNSPDMTKEIFFSLVFGALSFLMTLISICSVNLTWLKIWVAPKLYLIDYAASLLK